ncbi:MAG: hypothetical protein JOY64_09220 [Alphaproteobacteria bacterium]|nr:hypothetical protein [Alphaproteobacteria bacterium]MBV8407797.1 hypothetical protein [Alphaproteobacteria bacterium]
MTALFSVWTGGGVGNSTIAIAGATLDMFDAGAGAPMLFLHGCAGFDPAHRYAANLSRQARLLAPSHPGFGRSGLPDWITEVDDIAYIYLELLDPLALATVDLVACSIGDGRRHPPLRAPRLSRGEAGVFGHGVDVGCADHAAPGCGVTAEGLGRRGRWVVE